MFKGLSFMGLPIAIALCFASGGCGPVATLSYRQLGACDGFGSGFLMAGANKAFVFFRMDSLDNSSSSSVQFDPFQLNVPSLTTVAGEGRVDKTLSTEWATTLQGPVAGPATVAANTTQSLAGWGVMLVSTSTSDGAVEANNTAYLLVDAPGSGILPVTETPNRTMWPDTSDCGSINFTQQ
jgi:hypothetical protein